MQFPTGNGIGQARKGGSGWVQGLLAGVLVYTTWAWGGLRPSFHWGGVVLSGLLLVAALMAGNLTGKHGWGRDPVFVLGLCFLAFLGLQWANAGRQLYFNVGHQQWMYTPPRWPGWPSAFSRTDALQMVTWYFPAWVVALVLRGRLMSRRDMRRFLIFLAYNAGVLAAFGLVQFASGTRSIYWVYPLHNHFFASFAYGNHAAPFFVLMGALAAGLLFADVLDARLYQNGHASTRLRHPWRVVGLAVSLVLCLVGANLGLSRTGVVLSWMLAAFVGGYGVMRGWGLLPPAGRVNMIAITLAAACSLYLAVVGFGEKAILKEFTLKGAPEEGVLTRWERIDLELGSRPQFARAAIGVWLEQPWFGLGGWGYKYRVAHHVPERLWGRLETRGWANVHVDILQFLTEFGVVGMGLLLGALGVMVHGLFRRQTRRGALRIMGIGGLALVVVFSLIDLPFRCPAILYTWVAVLAALPVVCEIQAGDGDAMPTHMLHKRTGP
jgi:hypothetical protein